MEHRLSYKPDEFAEATGLGRDYVYGLCKAGVDEFHNPFPCKNCGSEKKPRYLIPAKSAEAWWEAHCAQDAATREHPVHAVKREA